MSRLKIVLDELTEDEAWALAQLCERLTWDEFRKLFANLCEHEKVDRAITKVRRALAEAGVNPR